MIEYANRHDEKGIGVFIEMKSILSISEAKGKFVRIGSQIVMCQQAKQHLFANKKNHLRVP
jgi:hypothetical protein